MRAVILAGGRRHTAASVHHSLAQAADAAGQPAYPGNHHRPASPAWVRRITMATGYLSHLLQAYFGDGSRFGIHIETRSRIDRWAPPPVDAHPGSE